LKIGTGEIDVTKIVLKDLYFYEYNIRSTFFITPM